MNLLVGATGFIGGHVVEYLFQQNEISKGTFRKGAHLKVMDLNGVQGIEAELLDHHSLHEAMEGADTVYSMASPMPGRDKDFVRVNVEGVSNLLEVAREAKVKAFVHLSTLDVYGSNLGRVSKESAARPGNEYQESKLQADRLLFEFAERNESPKVVVVRAAMAAGSRDSSFVVPLLKMIESGSAVLPASGKMSFTHPKDVAQAMYRAATSPKAGRLYLVKSFDATPQEFATSLASAVGKAATVKREGLFSKAQFTDYTRERLKSSTVLEAQDGWAELGYAPKYDLHSTCDEILQWYRKNPWATEQD